MKKKLTPRMISEIVNAIIGAAFIVFYIFAGCWFFSVLFRVFGIE